ncbi:MAG: NlpC/P60 family protein [Gemmatimonadota bacterium]
MTSTVPSGPAHSDALVVPTAVAPVRRDPAHGSELVSQWVLGEIVRVDDIEGGWVRARGADGYAGWTPRAPFRRTVFATEDWDAAATLLSMGTYVDEKADPAGDGHCLERLPWGARLRRADSGGTGVTLPDGRTVTPLSLERVVAQPGSANPPPIPHGLGETVARLAGHWPGVPYLWGGRTDLGVDCSGFVQAVFASVGIRLPRDSHQQAEAHPDLRGSGVATEPGDLLFFAPDEATITHVALALGGSRIIHAASSNGSVREDDLDTDTSLSALLTRSIVRHTRPWAG